jgi:hypothetical protein
MEAIPLTGDNIYLAAAVSGLSVAELERMKFDAQQQAKEKEQKEWALDFLGKDEAWYDDAMQKIAQIEATLPEGVGYREKTIRKYGWIADSVPQISLDIPMQTDTKYARAYSIELILTDLDGYKRVINWD